MRFGLSEEVIAQIGEILDRYPEVDSAVIYGSRAKGDYRLGSDIDLTLIGSSIDHAQHLAISGAIEDLMLPYTVDLSLFKEIENPNLRDHINRVGKTFYDRTSRIRA